MNPNQILKMSQELLKHKYLYYVLGEPEISDYEYDMLEIALSKADPGNEALQVVGWGQEDELIALQRMKVRLGLMKENA